MPEGELLDVSYHNGGHDGAAYGGPNPSASDVLESAALPCVPSESLLKYYV